MSRADSEPDDDDPDPSTATDVWRVLALRQLAVRLAEVGPVGDETRWLASAQFRARDRHRTRAEALLDAEPGLTAGQLADRLDPPRPPAQARRNGRPPDPLESTAAAQRVRAELADRRAQGPVACEQCEDHGWVELADGTWGQCDHRVPATATATAATSR